MNDGSIQNVQRAQTTETQSGVKYEGGNFHFPDGSKHSATLKIGNRPTPNWTSDAALTSDQEIALSGLMTAAYQKVPKEDRGKITDMTVSLVRQTETANVVLKTKTQTLHRAISFENQQYKAITDAFYQSQDTAAVVTLKTHVHSASHPTTAKAARQGTAASKPTEANQKATTPHTASVKEPSSVSKFFSSIAAKLSGSSNPKTRARR